MVEFLIDQKIRIKDEKKIKRGKKCPTCKDAKRGRCCNCEKIIPVEIQKLRVDPYRDEIDGDHSLHLMCDSCFEESANNI